jgi:hypothetical protein
MGQTCHRLILLLNQQHSGDRLKIRGLLHTFEPLTACLDGYLSP